MYVHKNFREREKGEINLVTIEIQPKLRKL